MSTAELNEIKLNWIDWIDRLSDVDLISFPDGLKNSGSQSDWWDTLSADQRKIVLSGLEDAQNGKLISSGDFREKLNNA